MSTTVIPALPGHAVQLAPVLLNALDGVVISDASGRGREHRRGDHPSPADRLVSRSPG